MKRVTNTLDSRVLSVLFAAAAAVFPCSCGEAIGDSQTFKQNKAPVIDDMTAASADGTAVEEHNILCDMRFLIKAEASDPEGKPLAWSFSSNCGSFSTPEDTGTGCTAYFITDMPKGNTPVTVTLVATDHKNAAAEKTITIGYGKPAPVIGISASALTVGDLEVKTLTLSADCEGTFQLYVDNTVTRESDAHIDASKSSCFVGYVPGGTAPCVSLYDYAAAASGFKLRLPEEPGVYSVWAVFQDKIEQEEAKLCTVTVN